MVIRLLNAHVGIYYFLKNLPKIVEIMVFFRLKIGKIILSLPLIQNPIKIYADRNVKFVFHDFKPIFAFLFHGCIYIRFSFQCELTNVWSRKNIKLSDFLFNLINLKKPNILIVHSVLDYNM